MSCDIVIESESEAHCFKCNRCDDPRIVGAPYCLAGKPLSVLDEEEIDTLMEFADKLHEFEEEQK